MCFVGDRFLVHTTCHGGGIEIKPGYTIEIISFVDESKDDCFVVVYKSNKLLVGVSNKLLAGVFSANVDAINRYARLIQSQQEVVCQL